MGTPEIFLLTCLLFTVNCNGQRNFQNMKGKFLIHNSWNGNEMNIHFAGGQRSEVVVKKPVIKIAKEASAEASGEDETSGSDEENDAPQQPSAPAVSFKIPSSSSMKITEPQKALNPMPGVDDDEAYKPRPVKQREIPQQKNWYVYDQKQRGRYFGADDAAGGGGGGPGGGAGGGGAGAGGGGGDGSGAGGGGGDGASGGSLSDADRKKKDPYKVFPAKVHQVDSSSYNFFQFQSNSKLGKLWITKSKKGGDLGGDDEGSSDIDDADPANKWDWQFRRYDRACLYQEYKKKKTDVRIPPVSEELKRLVDNQNEQLARRFIEWQFIDKETPDSIALQGNGTDHPHYNTFKFINDTVHFFVDKICSNSSNYVAAAHPNVPSNMLAGAEKFKDFPNTSYLADAKNFLPQSFIENLFNLFLVLRNVTMSDHDTDYATKADDDDISEKILKACGEEDGPHWFHHSCGDQVLSVDQYNNYACVPFINYDFNPKLFDPILDSVWLMFNAVHAFCFQHFQKNLRLWHKYAMIIANAYTPQMRLRWKASIASEKYYMRLLGPEFENNFEQISRCTFGTVLRSEVPMLLPRFDTPSVTTFGAAD